MSRAVTPTETPNPNALRFTLSEAVLGSESRTFENAAAARGVMWATRLFEVPGVVALFGVQDFVTVTKDAHTPWEAIVPHVVETLQDATF